MSAQPSAGAFPIEARPLTPTPADRVAHLLIEANGRLLEGASAARVGHALPSREAVAAAIAHLRSALFPWHFGGVDVEAGLAQFVRRALEAALSKLREPILRGLMVECRHSEGECPSCAAHAEEIVSAFVSRLPTLRHLLETDAWAAFDGDPAATSPDEAVFCYPGMTAMIHHRVAHALHDLRVPLVPRMISELAHTATGIDIHPGAQIGPGFFIDHGTGVVIGETCVIGQRVRLYQGVTLGARTFPLDENGRPIKGIPRHPVVEDDVIIYAGATILGRITIGHGSTIGGNVWVTSSLPPCTHVSQAQFRRDVFDGGAGI
jgi:serine O-acetyltransferase